jgi:hypothetical protein
MERTSTRPCSGPDTHTARQKPSRCAPQTTAHASSSTSRRSVCSHDSSPSGRPPGQLHRSPSLLISTTWLSRVMQNALAPCAVPSGSFAAECHSMNQAPPVDRTARRSPSTNGGGSVVIERGSRLYKPERARRAGRSLKRTTRLRMCLRPLYRKPMLWRALTVGTRMCATVNVVVGATRDPDEEHNSADRDVYRRGCLRVGGCRSTNHSEGLRPSARRR